MSFSHNLHPLGKVWLKCSFYNCDYNSFYFRDAPQRKVNHHPPLPQPQNHPHSPTPRPQSSHPQIFPRDLCSLREIVRAAQGRKGLLHQGRTTTTPPHLLLWPHSRTIRQQAARPWDHQAPHQLVVREDVRGWRRRDGLGRPPRKPL